MDPLAWAWGGPRAGLTLTGSHTSRTQFGAQLQCVTGPQSVPGELALKIYYGGSEVPSPGITFTYRENPVLRAFEPLRSFVRCERGPRWQVPPHPPRPAASQALCAHQLRERWQMQVRVTGGGLQSPPPSPQVSPHTPRWTASPSSHSAGWQCPVVCSGRTFCLAEVYPRSWWVRSGTRPCRALALPGVPTLALSPPRPPVVAGASTSQDRASA